VGALVVVSLQVLATAEAPALLHIDVDGDATGWRTCTMHAVVALVLCVYQLVHNVSCMHTCL
jgi:hypothetical protein